MCFSISIKLVGSSSWVTVLLRKATAHETDGLGKMPCSNSDLNAMTRLQTISEELFMSHNFFSGVLFNSVF